MNPRYSNRYDARQAAILETLVSGGFCAPALLELRVRTERRSWDQPLREPPSPVPRRVVVSSWFRNVSGRLHPGRGQDVAPTRSSPMEPA